MFEQGSSTQVHPLAGVFWATCDINNYRLTLCLSRVPLLTPIHWLGCFGATCDHLIYVADKALFEQGSSIQAHPLAGVFWATCDNLIYVADKALFEKGFSTQAHPLAGVFWGHM